MVNLLSDLIVISCKLNLITYLLFSFHVEKEKWSISTSLLKFFIYEIMYNFCIMKWNKNVEYKKNLKDTFLGSIYRLLAPRQTLNDF